MTAQQLVSPHALCSLPDHSNANQKLIPELYSCLPPIST